MVEEWHWLQGATAQSVPRRHIFLGAATSLRRDRAVHIGTWGGAVAVYHSAPKGRTANQYFRGYERAAQLWDDVDAWCKPKHRTVLWAWDLGVVVRLALGFPELTRRGWELMSWSIMPQSCWLVWRNGKRTLTMVDVASYFPMAFEGLEVSFGTVDPVTLDNMPTVPPHLVDVARRVDIIRRAVRAYLLWIERERLGAWQLTGTGQGFMAYRTRFYTHPILVHWDEDARAAERRAMWAGRTEAYWHGTIRGRRTDEWDMVAAYPRIAQRHAVPVELVATTGQGSTVDRWLNDPSYTVLVEGTVHTEVPVVPTVSDARILWPVGTFTSTLWAPELRLLRDVGGTVDVSRAFIYRTAPALADWADWILSLRDDRTGHVPAWRQSVAKHWSLSTVGRLGMQHDAWELLGRMPRQGLKWWTQRDTDTGDVSDLVHVGRDLWQSTGKVDWSMSAPQVPSFIASQCRADITTVWLEAPQRSIIYMDTDSLFAEGKHARAIHQVARAHPELQLRVKRSWRRITILGPRQLVTGERVRASGVPVRAQLLADGSLSGEVRESLRTAISRARATQVRVTQRRWHLREVDRRRSPGVDGWTEAVRLPAASEH